MIIAKANRVCRSGWNPVHRMSEATPRNVPDGLQGIKPALPLDAFWRNPEAILEDGTNFHVMGNLSRPLFVLLLLLSTALDDIFDGARVFFQSTMQLWQIGEQVA